MANSGRLRVRADVDVHASDMLEFRPHPVPRLYRLESERRSGHDDVARHQRVKSRGMGDQLGDAVLHVVRVGALPLLAVYQKSVGDIVRIGDLIGGDQPWAENRVGVDGLTRARRLRSAQRHVEAGLYPITWLSACDKGMS